MTDAERHRAILYGRIAASVLCLLAFVVLGLASVVTAAGTASTIWVVLPFGLAILLLPRRAVPVDEEKRSALGDELELLERVERWLLWTRVLYAIVAVGVLLAGGFL
ncbi:MAG: hypothetical protein ABEL76_02040 [Bradymonadaceae bacterium]